MVNLTTKLQTVDSKELKTLLELDKIDLIDVREADEYAREHIEGSKLISLSKFDVNLIPNNSDRQVILYCQSGNRSQQAAEKILASGFETIVHLEGGLNAWKSAGYPTKLNKKAPISIMRQVQIVAGSLVLTGTLLGAFVSPRFLFLSGFVGAGLTFAGISNTCAMASLLKKLPYNKIN
ncbi:MAG: rhodanese-like domain-containing protein [Prochloraceae cyanobacterium]|nr:rhodanese-like domain-containing protein [Prochloraceae cyanobacterium]